MCHNKIDVPDNVDVPDETQWSLEGRDLQQSFGQSWQKLHPVTRAVMEEVLFEYSLFLAGDTRFYGRENSVNEEGHA